MEGDNYPSDGCLIFDSSDHIRFENGVNVSGHNYNCNRRLYIEKSIEGNIGYTITMYNLDGVHPLWRNNIQMAPKRMRIINMQDKIVEFRGYGVDAMGTSFADYGLLLLIEDNEIIRAQLNMYDRGISIVYFK